MPLLVASHTNFTVDATMCFVSETMPIQLEEKMSAENSTENPTPSNNTTKAILDSSTAFFDPAWQLAITIEFYFRYAVLAIAVFGTASNTLVLYALVAYNARKAKKRAVNLLIIHQNVIDLSSCLLLIITYSIGYRTDLAGALGYFLCTFFVSESATYCSLYASVINLTSLTIERYLKVVYPFWAKTHIKRWMVHATMVFAWIVGILYAMPVVFVMTTVVDGHCVAVAHFDWETSTVRIVYSAFGNCLLFLLPLVIFVYCYGHIVVVMRRQMRVMAGHGAEGGSQANASQIQSKRVKWNITKTMIIVSVAFVVCWSPFQMYFMIVDNTTQPSDVFVGYFATMFLVYLNVCINPFIYAAKHEGVKQTLAGLMSCLKCKGPTVVGDSSGGNTNTAGRKQQARAGVT